MYKIGDKFTAYKNYPFGMEDEVEREEARYDIMDGEDFEIVSIINGFYKAYNTSCDSNVCTLMTEEDITKVIKDQEITMEELLTSIIREAIKDEFWSDESVLVSKYAEETGGEQLDCEGLVCWETTNPYGVMVCMGDKRYFIEVKK